MERLNRGVVAVTVSGGVYVGWRMFGFEYDAANPSERLVQRLPQRHDGRERHQQHQLPRQRRHVVVDVHRARGHRRRGRRRFGERPRVWAQQYLRIPLMVPPGGTTPVVQLRDRRTRPTRTAPTTPARPTSTATGSTRSSSSGTRRTRRTTRRTAAPATSTSTPTSSTGRACGGSTSATTSAPARTTRSSSSFDFDGDGRAEMAVKTAPGTRDGTGAYLRRARPRTTPTRTGLSTTARRLHADGSRVPDGVQRRDRRRAGDGRLRPGARHGELVGRRLRQPGRPLPGHRRLPGQRPGCPAS